MYRMWHRRPAALLTAIFAFLSLPCSGQIMGGDPAQGIQLYGRLVDTMSREADQTTKTTSKLVVTGVASALDLQAPEKAMKEYNDGGQLLHRRNFQDAIKHLKSAVEIYPNFVSAHNALGLAYVEVGERDAAQKEFETGAQLDPRFPTSFANLGQILLNKKDYSGAEDALQKAVALLPQDASVLTALAWTELAQHKYQHALRDAQHVHDLPHTGLANAHFIAGGAAAELRQLDVATSEYNKVLEEDPNGPLAPTAKINLKAIATYRAQTAKGPAGAATTEEVIRTFPNSERLRAALNSLENDESTCADCEDATTTSARGGAETSGMVSASPGGWTLRAVVDEVAVMFAVTDGNSLVEGLTANNISVRDARVAPARIIQFAPQSALPLRLGLLIDTSGSVQKRFDFEKKAASRFLSNVLTGPDDLAFTAGFASSVVVTQDFTRDPKLLEAGIESLSNSGSTALFDAVSYACWKLSTYPDHDRVARVLVLVTDGEDNGSRTSLRQAIEEAENTGITVYVISSKTETVERYGQVVPVTDADHVLQAIADRTGGDAMFPGDFQNLNKTFDKLRKVIRSRYLVAYKPANFHSDGKFRQIIITAKKDGKNFKVHARKGYYAPQGE